jgi:hypothetical protein
LLGDQLPTEEAGVGFGALSLLIFGEGVSMTTTVVVLVSVEAGMLVSLSHGSSSSGGRLGIGMDDFVPYAASFNGAVYGPSHQ